ncbi:hypothetical protein A2368_01945 [Candidatus Collierbacteria bacterium RIFOXYB1_FULL_49_13]|uniref:Aminoglycoside phosphotransferase domain-containing protein n=1 Tax=Candidatus Collierbacteria bacterium RIFOXYB1_FULL_49_13 TaxID=1817728 RepID=A0A1F5FGF2_9BACT|nr:MAG: hypothetical protein A2368_01945 [Candidatus Collierbacteria bacterium RIFOXYB1_FULL_49_13]
MNSKLHDTIFELEKHNFTDIKLLSRHRLDKHTFSAKWPQNLQDTKVVVKSYPSDDQNIARVVDLQNLGSQYIKAPKILNVLNTDLFTLVVCEYIDGSQLKSTSYLPISNKEIDPLIEYSHRHFRLIDTIPFVGYEKHKVETNHYIQRMNHHSQLLQACDKALNQSLKKIASYVEKLNLQINDYRLQHGDFYGSNIILNNIEESFYLIDWEHARISSKYLDISTMLAKELATPDFFVRLYKKIYLELSQNERLKFNMFMISSMVKEYKNLVELSPTQQRIRHINSYTKLIRNYIISLINNPRKNFSDLF